MPKPEALLAAVQAEAGDGFCRVGELEAAFRGVSRRDLHRSLRRALNEGWLIERRDRQRRHVVAIAPEGWRVLREA
jgi:hypothetical protein